MTIGHDMTPSIDPGRQKTTGPVRTKRPIYVDLLPPCNIACPAGENVQAWLALAQAGAAGLAQIDVGAALLLELQGCEFDAPVVRVVGELKPSSRHIRSIILFSCRT